MAARGLAIARSVAARATAVLPFMAKVMAPLVSVVVDTLSRSSSRADDRPTRRRRLPALQMGARSHVSFSLDQAGHVGCR